MPAIVKGGIVLMDPALESVRYRTILEMVIRQYISGAVPVGSRAISRDERLNLSSATIRNIMADLEEMGYLMQPHTSAGRVPTDKGYRYYVDRLMEIQRITQEEQDRIRREYDNRQQEIDNVLKMTTRMLSLLTHTPSMITAPARSAAKLRHLELLPLAGNRLLAVVIYQTGQVENLTLEVSGPDCTPELERARNYLNTRGRERTIAGLAEAVRAAAPGELSDGPLRTLVLELAGQLEVTASRGEETVLVDGASLLLEQPDFRDLHTIKEMLQALENRAALQELLREGLVGDGPVITIGREHKASDLRECSVVTRRYEIGGRPAGALGIVGPTRLEYPKVIAIIDYLAAVVGELLSEGRARERNPR